MLPSSWLPWFQDYSETYAARGNCVQAIMRRALDLGSVKLVGLLHDE